MRIHTCQFVLVSDLFKGLKALWNEFASSDPDFSFGGNNRTLVDPPSLLHHFDNSLIEDQKQLERLRRRIKKLPKDVYVDLEN